MTDDGTRKDTHARELLKKFSKIQNDQQERILRLENTLIWLLNYMTNTHTLSQDIYETLIMMLGEDAFVEVNKDG